MPYTPGMYSSQSSSGGYTPGMYSGGASQPPAQPGYFSPGEVGKRALTGAEGAIPLAAAGSRLLHGQPMYGQGVEGFAQGLGDVSQGLLTAATLGKGLGAGAAIGAGLEASGINPAMRAAAQKVENAYEPKTQSVLGNALLRTPETMAGIATEMLPTVLSGMGAKAAAESNVPVIGRSPVQPVAAGQELPALMRATKAGIGPEVSAPAPGAKSFLTGGQEPQSGMLDVLNSVKTNRAKLGDNIGQIVGAADQAAGPIDYLGNRVVQNVRDAFDKSDIQTPQAKAVLDKWVANEAPKINNLVDLHDSIKALKKTVKNQLGQGENLSSVPLQDMKDAMSDTLRDYMPGQFRGSFDQANRAFSQFATVENGLKASTPALRSALKGKEDLAVPAGKELALNPGLFSKWWNEAIPDTTKARMDPAFVAQLDRLTAQKDPNMILSGLKSAPVALGAGVLGEMGISHLFPGLAVPGGILGGLAAGQQAFNRFQKPTPQFYEPTPPLSPVETAAILGREAGSQQQRAELAGAKRR